MVNLLPASATLMTMTMLGAVLIVLVSPAQWDVLHLLHIILNLHPDSWTTMIIYSVYVTCVSILIYGMYDVWVF